MIGCFGISILIIIMISLFHNGIIVLDYSAEHKGNSILWGDKVYISCTGKYHEGETIAKTNDGWDLNEVKEDKTHSFIVARSFQDQYLLVRQDYKVPTDGNISAVFWVDKKIKDKSFCKTLKDILSELKTDFEYETEGIFMMTDTQDMKEVYLCYDDCPIGTSFVGYMGVVNNQWVITNNNSSNEQNDDLLKKQKVSFYKIPQKYIEILEKFK